MLNKNQALDSIDEKIYIWATELNLKKSIQNHNFKFQQ